ncbi:uncharacterized protein LOC122383900 [Amphibalanus amphitrite]|uniref:uncharacterized protein LOC122383900 n=1 Tax=Amphibalanus amphitrite TaxID=1232801 RepID=UPI001C90EF1D|nr:uncharacterized protein LOC122383900 [Amphibalanus amphitrite]
MTAAERRWTPLVRPLVILLLLVTVVGDAGPLSGAPPVLVTLELAGDVAELSTVLPSSSAGTTSPTLRTSPPTAVPTPTPTAVPTPTPTAVPTPTPTPGGICADPHAHRDQDGVCSCNSGYLVTRDDESFPNNTCRRSSGGYLGSRCSDISDCNYAIQHVACDDTCQCIKPYVGFNGETTCFDNAMGWGVAIKTAGITVLVLAVGFFIAFGVKGCTRSVRYLH